MPGHRAGEKWGALAVVVAFHLLLAVAFLHLTHRHDPEAIVDGHSRSTLILIEPEPVNEPRQRNSASVRPVLPETVEDTRSATAITVPPLPPPQPEAPLPRPTVDWHGEAERAARLTVEEFNRNDHRPFGEQRQRPSDDKPHQFEWNPEPKTVGFDGLLPYVRIGKRCAVGLGFFGCAIGELPEANGDLFEGMRDPNRPESSVPAPP